MRRIAKLTAAFISYRLYQYTLVFLSPQCSFDTSTKLLLLEYLNTDDETALNYSIWKRKLINKLIPWDSVFFIKKMMNQDGKPDFEHEYAFSQLWTELIRSITRIVYGSSLKGADRFYKTILIGIGLENLLFYLSVVTLYHLTWYTFLEKKPALNSKNWSYPYDIAYMASLLFIGTSAGGYITGFYSEPLSFFLSFLGMWCREATIIYQAPKSIDFITRNWPLYCLGSGVCFALATMNRSNCILLGIYYIFDLCQAVKVKKFKKAFFFPLCAGLILACSFIYQQFYLPYNIFCPPRREWCDTQIWKFITRRTFYTFIQEHYWNVGLLRYWTFSNIPNFFFPLPNIVFCVLAMRYFSRIYPNHHLKPIIYITGCLIVIISLFAHIQIFNRVSSFIPLQLWFIADIMIKSTRMSHNGANTDSRNHTLMISKAYFYWTLSWNSVQTVLFAFFLPPA